MPGLCGIGPALAGRLGERGGFRAVREGMMLFACNARSGPVPLPPGVCGWVVMERDRIWIPFVPMRWFRLEAVSRCRPGDGGV